ncbi:MAG: alpha/beta hydrolase [Clostridiales bacterium]|jgi:dienelactone hydrolase|nr:alpha/beta hydrolase [Clostridiales bacterium]MCI2160795.1 alpha/beta hydrolase [Oscillospiraceae bacterium]MCI1962369.1 alpha/beta hydrolase [Clostridiales bacterium]MCI2022819.1 alpha/beta hydrolase [Clostridiales bacterium]MCI2027216.1 alpha/beta hydrolase [Clostridiales bacterium]
MKGKNKSKIIMVVSLIFVFLFMSIASYFNSGCGTVSVRNIYYPDSNGHVLRAQLFIPNGVSADKRAPAILNMHGGGDNLECVGNFSSELARRGYVVLSVDEYGSGFSDYVTGNIATGAGGSKENKSKTTAMDGGASTSLKQLLSYDFVDQDNIGLIGHSMGGSYITNAALQYSDHIKAIMPWGSGSFLDLLKKTKSEDYKFSVGYLNGKNDEMIIFSTHLDNTSKLMQQDFMKKFFNTDKDIVAGQVYGSFDQKNARVIYTPTTSHIGNLVCSESVSCLLSFFESAMPTGTNMGSTSQVWQFKEGFDLLAILALLCFAVSLGYVLFSGKLFGSLVYEGNSSSVKMNKPLKWIGIILLIAIPMITLYSIGLPLTTIKSNQFFPMDWSNYFVWLTLINAAIILVLFLIWHFAYGKKHGGSLQSYGILNDNVNWKQIIKSAGFAVAIVFAIYVIVNSCYSLFNIDFRFWIFAIKPITTARLPYILGYLLLLLVSFGILNVASVSFAGLSTDDDSKLGVLKQYVIGWLIGAAGFTIIVLIYYMGLKFNHYPPFFYGFGPFPQGHPNSLVFSMKLITIVPQFTFASILNTAFYRKTKNIYVGSFVAALLLAMIAVTGNAFTY